MSSRRNYGWAGDVATFLSAPLDEVLSSLKAHTQQLFANVATDRLATWQDAQRVAWSDELRVLHTSLTDLVTELPTARDWGMALEYELPQQGGRRPDVILLAGGTLVILEFKMKNEPTLADIDQLSGYLRDIEDYHATARNASRTCGALVATLGKKSGISHGQQVLAVADLARYLISNGSDGSIALDDLLNGQYEPAPALLDAAIANWEFAPPQLKTVASSTIPDAERVIRQVITDAQNDPPKTRRLVLVSGTPGAGKTFVGLNLVHDKDIQARMRFLSGNGPLVMVLNFALQQNQELVTAMHKYRDHFEHRNPTENVIVFDEAQRALDAEKMRIKFGRAHSESHIMLDILTRTPDWGVMVLLVGNGQEIYNGEVGLNLWFEALRHDFHDVTWHVHLGLASLTNGGHLVTEDSIKNLPPKVIIHDESNLHLTTSIRTHRAGHVHDWVNTLLSGDIDACRALADSAREDGFALYITRNLGSARNYLTDRYSGAPRARYGLLMASRNERFFSHDRIRALEHSDVARWYVDRRSSQKSCTQLTTAATEFQCQGLEVDFAIIAWADDMKWDETSQKWTVRAVQTPPPLLADPEQTRINVYRVLLTRGRDGIVLYLPPTGALDSTYAALRRAGATPMDEDLTVPAPVEN